MDSRSTCDDTLRILHLPPYLLDSQREALLKRYGATRVKTLRKSEKYTVTFAKFQSKRAAKDAFLRLHQLEVRGQHLSVEFSKTSFPTELVDGAHQHEQTAKDGETKDSRAKPQFQAFLKKLNGWAMSQVFTQPPPPNIWYKYSPPTRNTVLRIAVEMLNHPAFYTQVLHLMNRMNLPPPFDESGTEFPQKYSYIFEKDETDKEEAKDERTQNKEGEEKEEAGEEEEEEESELESDEGTEIRPKEIIPAKRKLPQSARRLKIPKFVNPTKQRSSAQSSMQKIVKPEDVFESIERGENKSMKFALKSDSQKPLDDAGYSAASVAPSGSQETDGGFGLMFPVKPQKSKDVEDQEFITSEELAANRISVNDRRLLPVFKNYHAGKSSCRLYIKNLAKQIESKDLRFIYQKYVIPDMENAEYQFDVRLMQEGRMKGQAFVTLQTVEQAKLALEETNGYILKDKPMVVQFAKAGNKPQTDR